MAKKEPTRGSQNRAGSRNVTDADRQAADAPLTEPCNYWEENGRDYAEARRLAREDAQEQ
jgi:hypothetical protein